MTEDRDWVDAFLAGRAETLAEARAWIHRSASPFRKRLATEWEDLQQQLLLEVLEDLRDGRYRGSGSIRGFVGRTVVHSCIDRIRHHERWRFTPVDVLRSRPDLGESQPEGYLALQALARRLGPECRRLFQMIVAGLSYREMSERLDAKEGALRARVLRCRERARELRHQLEPSGETNP